MAVFGTLGASSISFGAQLTIFFGKKALFKNCKLMIVMRSSFRYLSWLCFYAQTAQSKFGLLQNLTKICFFLSFAKSFLKKIQNFPFFKVSTRVLRVENKPR
jgi:hypothetical protein